MATFANCDTIISREDLIMAKAMTKAALVNRLAKNAGLTKKDMSVVH